MATGVTHSFVSAKAQGGDATVTSKDEWNDSHDPDLTTKGDMIAEGASAAARLPVGANKTLLGADSGQALGVKYIARSTTSELADIGDAEATGSDETVPFGDHVHKHPSGLNSDLHHVQSHTVASHSDTTATGAELETLTDGSGADALHVHGARVRKSANESVNSSGTGSTLQNDNHLKITMLANETWMFEAFIVCGGHSDANIKLAFTVPSGATLLWGGVGPLLAAGSTHAMLDIARASASSINYDTETGTDRVIMIRGTVENGATPGDLQLQWAQAAANAANTTIFENSWLIGHRV